MLSSLLDADTEQLLAKYDLPETTKTASRGDRFGSPELPAHLYGEPRQRKYALHTPAAVLTSAALFDADREAGRVDADTTAVWDRIQKAATYYGVGGALQDMLAAKAASANQAIPDEHYGIVIRRPNGNADRNFPLRNPTEIKTAAAYLTASRADFPYLVRQQFADRILTRAEELGVSLDDEHTLQKTAGRAMPEAKHTSRQLALKAAAYARKHPNEAASLRALAAKYETPDATTLAIDNCCKLASLIDSMDREYGYLDSNMLAEDVVFAITPQTVKQASQGWVRLANGAIFETDALLASKRAAWEACGFVEEDAGLLSEQALDKVAEQLSSAQADLLVDVLGHQGIRPIHQDPVDTPRPDLAKLAQEYSPRG